MGDPTKKANKIAKKNAKKVTPSGKSKRAMSSSSKRKSSPKKSNASASGTAASGRQSASKRRRGSINLPFDREIELPSKAKRRYNKVKGRAPARKKVAKANNMKASCSGRAGCGPLKVATNKVRAKQHAKTSRKVAKSRGKRTYYGSK